MATLVFKLNGVPEDEAYDVRDLLIEHEIDYHETTSGILGLSVSGIWIKDPDQVIKARTLIDEYQAKRASQATRLTLGQLIARQPLKWLFAAALICALAALLIWPFVWIFSNP